MGRKTNSSKDPEGPRSKLEGRLKGYTHRAVGSPPASDRSTMGGGASSEADGGRGRGRAGGERRRAARCPGRVGPRGPRPAFRAAGAAVRRRSAVPRYAKKRMRSRSGERNGVRGSTSSQRTRLATSGPPSPPGTGPCRRPARPAAGGMLPPRPEFDLGPVCIGRFRAFLWGFASFGAAGCPRQASNRFQNREGDSVHTYLSSQS